MLHSLHALSFFAGARVEFLAIGAGNIYKTSLTLLGSRGTALNAPSSKSVLRGWLLSACGFGGMESFSGVVLWTGFTARWVPAKQQRGMAVGSSCSRMTARPRAVLYEGLLLAGAGYGISVYQPKQHAKPM